MITIIDYGVGNLRSIANMIEHVGGKALITNAPSDIIKAEKLLLPGVGHFDAAAAAFSSSNLKEPFLEKVTQEKVPVLGICVGLQLLARKSEEGMQPGLGLIDGDVKRFKFSDDKKLRIPHMGWNYVQSTDALFKNMPEHPRFYFAHSYHIVLDKPNQAAAITDYGYEFVCGVRKDNIVGMQFHPEKSHKYGMQLFRNFLAI